MKILNYFRAFRGKHVLNQSTKEKNKEYYKRFTKYSFVGNRCMDGKQYEAVITRWYHTIEKGLAYENFRPGFGKHNLNALLEAMENYLNDGYSENEFFFRTALSTLHMYIEKNKQYGYVNAELEERINKLRGTPNHSGGVIEFTRLGEAEVKALVYKDFVLNRHSLRHFSDEPVELERVKEAVELAQHTPSACNRQGWRTIVITNHEIMKKVLQNQNGNEGFGHEFDKLLLITADLRCFNRDRELYQAYIDGGMYAESMLNSLHYEGIASVPLSASLKMDQEKCIRALLPLHDAEVPIMFIGIGDYPPKCRTTKSERKTAEITVI